MLDKPGSEIVYDETGKAIGVKDAEGTMAQCESVVCDPSYAKEKCKVTGKVRTRMWKETLTLDKVLLSLFFLFFYVALKQFFSW